MSRRASLRAGLAGLVLVAAGAVGWAQDAAGQVPEEELVRRIESLRPALEEARAAAEEARRRREEAAARRRTQLDTVRIGPLRVLAFPDQVELTEELFAEVWREDYSRVAASPALERWAFTFQWRPRLRVIRLGLPSADGPLVRQIDVNRVWEPTRASAKRRIRNAIATVLTEDFEQGSPLRSWLNERGHPDPELVYRFLAITPSGASRACMSGEARACWTALGLGLREAGPRLGEWLGPERQRVMVRAALDAPGSTLDPDDPVVRACLEDEDARACTELLSQRVEWTAGAPLPNRAYAHMLWHAVRQGGEGAWQRALERRDASPLEVLTYVSGLEPGELARTWRASLIESRPDVYAGLGTTRWAVLFWTLALAVLAMRSTRWRLG